MAERRMFAKMDNFNNESKNELRDLSYHEKRICMYKYVAVSIKSLCEKALELFFYIAEHGSIPKEFLVGSLLSGIEECKSPIEQIMCISLNYTFSESDVKAEVEQQSEIRAAGHNYIADFLITDVSNGCRRFIVECDGHEFHERTREQVENGNERDLILKTEGYEVIHLSGSQIYNHPLESAYKVLKFARVYFNGRY